MSMKLGWMILGAAWLALTPFSASAFDSPKRASTHTPRTPLWPPPIDRSSSPFGTIPNDTLNGGLRYDFALVRQALGGYSGDAPVNTPLYRCPRSFLETRSLEGCSVIPSTDLEEIAWGWANARVALDAPREDDAEHRAITALAARHAGLADSALLEPFWVRYPSADMYIASPLDAPDGSLGLVVAQSFQPTGFDNISAHALRGISLLDFSQLPDFSHSLADWVSGNEQCPIAGLDGSFRDISFSGACHSFEHALGMVNATHFPPLSEAVYNYYHGLARARMSQCVRLTPFVERFYASWDRERGASWMPTALSSDTEAHECEREAFAYEMIAQHFLQDRWSSGHMWKRWGYAEYEDFPYEIHIPWQLVEDGPVPAGNVAARRAGIASFVGIASGMIHGAKAVLVDQLRHKIKELLNEGERAQAAVLESLIRGNMVDDPLCGPRFVDGAPSWTSGVDIFKNVEWRASGLTPQAGVGDLFWNPALTDKASLRQDDSYREQRKRLLACSAASMREVYVGDAQNPAIRAHGPIAAALPVEGVDITTIIPTSDYCWGHWATNKSMAGAVGPVDLLYGRQLLGLAGIGWALAADPAILLAVATDFTILNTVGGLNFPPGSVSETTDQATIERIEDRDKFLRRLLVRAKIDQLSNQSRYIENAEVSASGTASAEGRAADGSSLTMLGVPPVVAPTVDPPTTYADNLTATGFNSGTAHMFWRGRIEQTCRDSVAPLNALRSRCIDAAALGGDPDACTACTYLAELHIPSCGPYVDSPFESKCSALGEYSIDTPPAGLPRWWFDAAFRKFGTPSADTPPDDLVNCGYPSWYVAFHWCTGTPSTVFQRGTMISRVMVGEPETIYTEQCAPGTPDYHVETFRSYVERLGVGVREFGFDNAQAFVVPVVNAFTQEVTEERLEAYPCTGFFNEITDYDAKIESAIGMPIWDNRPKGHAALVGRNDGLTKDDYLKVQTCGPRQRVGRWNKLCSEVFDAVPSRRPPATVSPNVYDPAADGWFYADVGSDECLLHEPRGMAACPAGSTCGVGGYCIAARCSGGSCTPPQTNVMVLDVR